MLSASRAQDHTPAGSAGSTVLRPRSRATGCTLRAAGAGAAFPLTYGSCGRVFAGREAATSPKACTGVPSGRGGGACAGFEHSPVDNHHLLIILIGIYFRSSRRQAFVFWRSACACLFWNASCAAGLSQKAEPDSCHRALRTAEGQRSLSCAAARWPPVRRWTAGPGAEAAFLRGGTLAPQ